MFLLYFYPSLNDYQKYRVIGGTTHNNNYIPW